MSVESLAAFSLAMIALSASPGPGVAAVVGRALQAGVGQAFVLIAGLILGDLAYMVAALAGWAAVAMRLGEVFVAIRLAGAAYLIYLGVKTWRAANKGPELNWNSPARASGSFGLGLAVTLGNPKVMFFYLVILPTFVDPQTLTAPDVLALSLIVAASSFAVLGAYAALAVRGARRLTENPNLAGKVRKTTGGLLIGTGIALAVKSN